MYHSLDFNAEALTDESPKYRGVTTIDTTRTSRSLVSYEDRVNLCRKTLVVDVKEGIQVIRPPSPLSTLAYSLELVRVGVLLVVIRSTEEEHKGVVEDRVVLVPIVLPKGNESLSSLCLEKFGLLLKRHSIYHIRR